MTVMRLHVSFSHELMLNVASPYYIQILRLILVGSVRSKLRVKLEDYPAPRVPDSYYANLTSEL